MSAGKLAVQYEREINRAGDDEILSRWQSKNGVEVIPYEDLDIDSFKAVVESSNRVVYRGTEKTGL